MKTIVVILLLAFSPAWAADRVASGVTVQAVQQAVDQAQNGDRVLIPNGAATWSSGVNVSKQILVQAQNLTPTRDGATTRNVTITNNSGTPLFTFVTGNDYHVGIGGIAFKEGSGNGSHVNFSGSGDKPPLIYDCYFENKSRYYPAEQCIRIKCHGGVMWNCYVKGTFNVGSVGEAFLLIKIEDASWETPSTAGMLDTRGTVNFYIEDSSFKDAGLIDMDDNARMAMRHTLFDGSWAETHGFTSTWGGRYFEFYDMTFKSTTAGRNLSRRYFWCRAGSGVFTNCQVDNASDSQSYGSINLLNIGDNTLPKGPWLIPRQPGSGYSNKYVSDPIYIWGNTGDRASTVAINGDWAPVVQMGRDVLNSGAAKPGYQKFTYPHPLREVVESGKPQPTPPPTPPPIPTPSPSPTATPTPTPTPGPVSVRWEDIIGKPDTFPPDKHTHSLPGGTTGEN